MFVNYFFFQEKIEAINQAIVNEYEVRRKLLVKRLDVTVQSFGWSDRAKVQLAMKSWLVVMLYNKYLWKSPSLFHPS